MGDGGSLASVLRQTTPADALFPTRFRLAILEGEDVAISRGVRIPMSELQLLELRVTRDGGSLRLLEGARYGIHTSLYRAEIVPGSGPTPHVHPYAEIFVIEAGQGRYEIGDDSIDAGGGDIVIVPPNATHGFVNTGTELLRHVAIHEGAEHIISTSVSGDPR